MFSKDVAYSKLKEDKDILEIDNLKKDLQVRLRGYFVAFVWEPQRYVCGLMG